MDSDIGKIEVTSEIIKSDVKEGDDDKNALKNATREVQFEDQNDIYNKNANNEDVIEEDVPSDFFDDFMNNEFMEGLDVVDAWDEDETKEEEKKPIDTVKRHQNVSFRRSKDNQRNAIPRERVDNRRDPEKTKRAIAKDKEKCAKDKEAKIISEKLKIVETGLVPPGMETEVDLKEIKKQEAKILHNDRISLKEGKDKPDHTHNFNREKPKHSMKDKMSNVIKDLREKLPAKKDTRVSPERKLQPGRNSRERRDILHGNSREHKNIIGKNVKSTIEKREILRHSRESRDTFDRSSRGKREVIITPAHEIREPVIRERFRSKSKSSEARLRYYKRRLEERDARLSSEKRLRLRSRSRSYHRGKKSYSRSPRRHLNIAEERHRRRDSPPLRRKSRGGSHFKFSPSPVMSEREMWLRHKPRNLGSPPKEPHHILGIERRTIGFLEELADKLKSDELKKSNLFNEIQKQLNEPSKHSSYLPPRPHMHESPMMVDFIPAPVPPPPQQNFYLPPPLQQQRPPEPILQFDEEFFIGQPTPFPDPNSNFDHNFSPYQNMPPQQYYNNPPPGNHLPSQPINFPVFENPNNVNLSPPVGEQQAIITQLFENKKISLSDYLKSISTKTGTDSAATIPIQKKVKVITLCQDVINSIGDDFEGRFFLKPWKKPKQQDEKSNEDDKTRTPMKKPPVVRFNFTTKCKTGKEKSYLYSTCNKLLATVGLEKTPPESPPYPPPQKINTPVVMLKNPPTPIAKPENEPFKCHTCEIRKARQFTDSGLQCKSEMVSVGTQMTDEDLIRFGSKPTLKGILKNQSLAELTPAQLLSQSSLGNNSNARMNQPHSSDQGFVMSPEKKFDFHPNRPIFPSASNFELMNKPMDNKPSQLMQLDLGQQYFDFDNPRSAFGEHIPQRQNNKKGKKRRGKFMQGLGPGPGPPKPYYNM